MWRGVLLEIEALDRQSVRAEGAGGNACGIYEIDRRNSRPCVAHRARLGNTVAPYGDHISPSLAFAKNYSTICPGDLQAATIAGVFGESSSISMTIALPSILHGFRLWAVGVDLLAVDVLLRKERKPLSDFPLLGRMEVGTVGRVQGDSGPDIWELFAGRHLCLTHTG